MDIGTFLAIAAIVVTIFIGVAQILSARTRKQLSLEVVLFSPLLSITEIKHLGELKVTLGEREITNAIQSGVIRLRNTGNQPILATDYAVPISFSFSKSSSVLFATVDDASSPSLKDTFDLDFADNEVVLPRTLLNRGEWVTINMIVVDHDGEFPIPHYRVVGVPEIHFGAFGTERQIAENRGLAFFAGILVLVNALFGLTTKETYLSISYILLSLVNLTIFLRIFRQNRTISRLMKYVR